MMISGRFELVSKNGGVVTPNDSDASSLNALDELFATAIGSLIAPVSCGGHIKIERITGTWRWMIDFESKSPNVQDIVMEALRALTHKTTAHSKVKDLMSDEYRDIWHNFCLLAMLVQALTLEVDLLGASDGTEQFLLPNSFTEATVVQDYQVIPFEENFDCIVSNDEETETQLILHASTLEKMTTFDELAWEFQYAHDGGISDSDRVSIKAERHGVVVLTNGAILLHAIYAVSYMVMVFKKEKTKA